FEPINPVPPMITSFMIEVLSVVLHPKHQELGRRSLARVSANDVHVVWRLVERHAAAVRAEMATTSDTRRPSRSSTSPCWAAAMKESRRRFCLVELAGIL